MNWPLVSRDLFISHVVTQYLKHCTGKSSIPIIWELVRKPNSQVLTQDLLNSLHITKALGNSCVHYIWALLMSQKAGVWRKVQLAAIFWWKHSELWERKSFISGFTKERKIREHEMSAYLNQSCKSRATTRTEKNYLANTITFTQQAIHRGSDITASQDQNAYAVVCLAAPVTNKGIRGSFQEQSLLPLRLTCFPAQWRYTLEVEIVKGEISSFSPP